MARIVVIEDEPDLWDVLAFNLQDAGHEVRLAASGREGLALVRASGSRPDLVLLDVMLPDVSGLEVCRSLKGDAATRDVSVVILSAKGEEADRVTGFELGADDYVTKPFSVRELLLRIQAVLRRRTDGARPAAPPSELDMIRVDRDGQRVSVNDRNIGLTVEEFKLFVTLYDHKDLALKRDVLIANVWGLSGDATWRTVDAHMKRLREKLGEASAFVETVRGGWGYRFGLRREGT